MNNHLISLMVLLPLIGVIFQAFLPKRTGVSSESLSRWAALVTSLAGSIFGFILIATMSRQTPELQAVESFSWVGAYAISYEVGIDGLSALLVLLVAIVFPILIAAEWNQKNGSRGMYALFLILQSTLAGALCAQDLFLQFFFWAVSALPFYFLVGIWGGEQRENSASRLISVSSIGNAFVLAALILIYYAADPHTFSLRELANSRLAEKNFEIFEHRLSVAPVAFGLLAAGLGLRTAVWPFHGWFTGVAKEAPASVFVALCGATIPVGVYIFIRLAYSLFPETLVASVGWIIAVGVLNVAVGMVSAVAQRDLRLLLAFFCISEMGFILIGLASLNPAGMVGAVYQQLSLGLGLAGFGLFSGIITERAGHSVFLPEDGETSKFGGVAMRAPLIAVIAGAFTVSLLGFPGFGGFVGKTLVYLGSYPGYPVPLVIAIVTMLLATYCLFTMYRQMFLGHAGAESEKVLDLGIRERSYLLPLVLALLICGIYPKPLLELVRPTVLTLLSLVK